jgi:type I restriction enzyme S subunit
MIVGDLVDGGFAEIRTGPFGTQLKAADYVDRGRPVLNVRNVGFGDVRPEKLEFVDESTAERLSEHILREGDIVFGRKGAVERHAFIRSEYDGAMQGSDCIRLRLSPHGPIRPGFATFALRTHAHQAWMRSYCSHGATMASLNQEIVRQIELPDLDLAAQDAVIRVLQTIDDLIENNRRRVAVLDEMARAIYRQWFVHFRFPGHDDAIFAESDLGPIPDGWRLASLADISRVNRSSRKPSPGEALQYLDISCLRERDLDPPARVAGEEAPGRARRVVAAGDIVWSMVRPNRRAHALLVAPGEDWIASTGMAVVTATEVPTSYLFEVLSSTDFSNYLVSRQRGSAYPAVTVQDFEEAPVLVPDPTVRDAFDDAVAPVHHLAWQLREQSQGLATIRNLLLPKLVTGQIDVSDLDLDAVVEKAGD